MSCDKTKQNIQLGCSNTPSWSCEATTKQRVKKWLIVQQHRITSHIYIYNEFITRESPTKNKYRLTTPIHTVDDDILQVCRQITQTLPKEQGNLCEGRAAHFFSWLHPANRVCDNDVSPSRQGNVTRHTNPLLYHLWYFPTDDRTIGPNLSLGGYRTYFHRGVQQPSRRNVCCDFSLLLSHAFCFTWLIYLNVQVWRVWARTRCSSLLGSGAQSKASRRQWSCSESAISSVAREMWRWCQHYCISCWCNFLGIVFHSFFTCKSTKTDFFDQFFPEFDFQWLVGEFRFNLPKELSNWTLSPWCFCFALKY